MDFLDREDAGRQLALGLERYSQAADGVVVGLPRGGVVVAYEVARSLGLPLDVIVVRKVGAPLNPEVAMGAVTESGLGYFNADIIAALRVSKAYLEKAVERERRAVLQRVALLRQYCKKKDLAGKTVILVDDGLATGATMRAAIQQVKAEKALRVVVAVPVASSETLQEISGEVDEAEALQVPPLFYAVGQVYKDFSETSDDKVIDILRIA